MCDARLSPNGSNITKWKRLHKSASDIQFSLIRKKIQRRIDHFLGSQPTFFNRNYFKVGTRESGGRFLEKRNGPLTRDDDVDKGSGGERFHGRSSAVCCCICDFHWSNIDQVTAPKAAFLRFHFDTLSTTFTCVFWSLDVDYEQITGCKSCPRRSIQEEYCWGALGDHAKWPWWAGQVNTAVNFINVLNKHTDESYRKEDMQKGRFHTIKKNKGVVPYP